MQRQYFVKNELHGRLHEFTNWNIWMTWLQAHVSAEFRRPKPMNRHTSAATGPDEEKVVTSGSLNIAGIREVLLLHQGLSEGQEKPLDAEALSKKYNVDVELLEGLFRYTTLPAPQTPEDSSQTPQRKLRKAWWHLLVSAFRIDSSASPAVNSLEINQVSDCDSISQEMSIQDICGPCESIPGEGWYVSRRSLSVVSISKVVNEQQAFWSAPLWKIEEHTKSHYRW